MSKTRRVLLALAVAIVLSVQNFIAPKVLAAVPAGDLAIIEFKMVGSESIVLQNISGTNLNLSDYLLQYFNKSTGLNFNTPTSSQQLPDFQLLPGQSFLLSGDTTATCGAVGETALSMALSDSNGYVRIMKIVGPTTYVMQDQVNWTSTSSTYSSGGVDLFSGILTPVVNNPVWYRSLPSGNWTIPPYSINTTPCNAFVTVVQSSAPTYIQWANGSAAPSVIIATDSSSSGIPADDIGLAAVQITELLSNPAGTGNDSTDEFVELYNPNDQAFDLSGFTLESGLTTKHDYTLDDGASIPAKSFAAFYSADTGLTLSNTSSQVWLLDPLGNIVSQTDSYSSAKDGLAWALAGSTWYWTSTPTPGAANFINGVSASTLAKSKTHTTPAVGSVNNSSNGGSGSGTNNTNGASLPTTAVHPWTIAGVGAAALLYAGYEYRTDLASNVYRIRRYAAARRAAGK